MAATVRPGGRIFVHCLGRGDHEVPAARPWPVSHRELGGFAIAGLDETEFADQPATPRNERIFTAVYTRPEPD
jgi:hypothetical protein